MSTLDIVAATGNANKVVELRDGLGLEEVTIISLKEVAPDAPEPVEDGDTFLANAIIKAQAAYALTGIPSLADDSGLAVNALGGGPGIFSARYAGEDATDADNRLKLIHELVDIAEPDRTAQFVCALALVGLTKNPITAEASCEGSIAFDERGEGGFGYDSLFIPIEFPEDRMATITAHQKNIIGHRGRALASLKEQLVDILKNTH